MKKYEVYLTVYDFLSFNRCLAALGVGAYHTGIQIGEDQYCFCVVSTNQKQTGVVVIQPQTAPFIYSHKIRLGELQIMNYRLNEIIDQFKQKYVCGLYHIFQNNCNHFSNQLSLRLFKKQIPYWIFRSTDILKYLCCCLPKRLTNGQMVLQKMIQQQRLNEEQMNQLLDK